MQFVFIVFKELLSFCLMLYFCLLVYLIRCFVQNTLKLFSYLQQQPKSSESYVGFANLPNQLYRKSVKQGFEFTLMVVGMLLIILAY